jgi:ribonucleoside-diphosphate reductase beta chain
VVNSEILKRASDIAKYYDELIQLTQVYSLHGAGTHQIQGETVVVSLRELKKALYLCMMSVNALEAVRFYVSFACSFAFAERRLMEGNAKIIRLIARDEALHLNGTQHIIALMQGGKDDPEMGAIAAECQQQAYDIFYRAAEQEKEWAKYLFKDGSMIGLNEQILCQYVEYITNHRMKSVNLPSPYPELSNPLPWMKSWLESDAVQVAPQEVEISSYLIGQIDASVNSDAFLDFDL